jgi:hypothetical protein
MDTNIIPPIASAVAAALSAFAAFLSFRLNKSGHKFISFGKIFEILNDNAHRNARIRLYVAASHYYNFIQNYQERELDNCKGRLRILGAPPEPDRIIPESANIVLSDFDQLGTLVKKN